MRGGVWATEKCHFVPPDLNGGVRLLPHVSVQGLSISYLGQYHQFLYVFAILRIFFESSSACGALGWPEPPFDFAFLLILRFLFSFLFHFGMFFWIIIYIYIFIYIYIYMYLYIYI